MNTVDSIAADLYHAAAQERGPRWDQLGPITQAVWRENIPTRVLNMLSTKQVCERLGFTLTAPFIIDTLGVKPTEKVKNGYFFDDKAVTAICGALVTHISTIATTGNTPQPVVEDPNGDLFREDSCDDLFA